MRIPSELTTIKILPHFSTLPTRSESKLSNNSITTADLTMLIAFIQLLMKTDCFSDDELFFYFE